MRKLKIRHSLNVNTLKFIAIVAMTLDHVAYGFLPETSVVYQVFRFLGRFTGPTMAFFIAEGYVHTHDLKKYMLRLFAFSLISWVPFSLFCDGAWPTLSFSVITTLLLGLVAICVWDRDSLSQGVRIAAVVLLTLLSVTCDWGLIGVPLVVVQFILRNDERRRLTATLCILGGTVLVDALAARHLEPYMLGLLVAPVALTILYSGERGKKTPFRQWFFYWYYPLHLLALWGIRMVLT